MSPVRACVIPGQRNWPVWWWFSRTGEHIGYESRSRSGRRAEGKADVVSFAVQRIANPGLADRFTRRLSLTERGRGSVYTGAAKGYVDYKTFDQMARELRA